MKDRLRLMGALLRANLTRFLLSQPDRRMRASIERLNAVSIERIGRLGPANFEGAVDDAAGRL